jgi:uncharacterized protein YjbI with pentapeptide repeats
MANDKHVALLKKGAEAWNAWRADNPDWRADNPDIRPDLRGANLVGADLSGADLRGALLAGVDLKPTIWSDSRISLAGRPQRRN